MLLLSAALLTPSGAGAQFAATIERDQENNLQVSWSDPSPNDGYAVFTSPDLTTGWHYAGDVDQWPSATNSWPVTTPDSSAFFKVQKTDRGHLISAEYLNSQSAWQVNLALLLLGVSGISADYPVDVFKLTYETFDARGQSTIASGAVCIPNGPATAPLASYQHGTVYLRSDAPSNSDADEQFLGVVFASLGYIVTMPDYLGLGPESPALHPYLHARSEAVAAVDLLRAATEFLDSGSPSPNGQLFLCGYSQGGHATLALQRELELNHAAEFPVTASAPMSGPHDLSGTMREQILSDEPYSSPGYIAYLLFGYNTVYHLFDSPSEVLRPPYDTTLPPLFDGEHTEAEINAAMPADPKQIFTPEYLADFTANSNNPFRLALRANDTYRWAPGAPTQLSHCAADTTVPATNSIVALAEMQARGATQVTLIDPAPTADHAEGAVPSFLAARDWFETFR